MLDFASLQMGIFEMVSILEFINDLVSSITSENQGCGTAKFVRESDSGVRDFDSSFKNFAILIPQ